jgi:hypothetical protein
MRRWIEGDGCALILWSTACVFQYTEAMRVISHANRLKKQDHKSGVEVAWVYVTLSSLYITGLSHHLVLSSQKPMIPIRSSL